MPFESETVVQQNQFGKDVFMKLKSCTISVLLLATILNLSLTGCAQKADDEKKAKVVKLGTLSTLEPFITVLKDALVAKGYRAEVVMFDANNMPAIATKAGDIDGFIHNHLPWIETFNRKNNSSITMVKPYLCYYRTGLYSSKYKSLDQLPNGAQIAVPNDPTNLEKSLLMLQDLGLLTLNPKADRFYTVLDINKNPKRIKLLETEISFTARSINDADAVICPAVKIKAAGIDPNSFLAEDLTKANFPAGLSVDAKSLKAPWVSDAMQILGSDEMRKKFEEIFSGTLVLYKK